jgi:hypothetical protein
VAGRRFAPNKASRRGGGGPNETKANKDFLYYGLLLFICYLSKSASTAVIEKY